MSLGLKKRRTSVKAPEILLEYYQSLSSIDKRRLAAHLDMTYQGLSQLAHGSMNMSLELAILVVTFSNGHLTVEQLRPDLSPYLETIISVGDDDKCNQIMIRLKKPQLE